MFSTLTRLFLHSRGNIQFQLRTQIKTLGCLFEEKITKLLLKWVQITILIKKVYEKYRSKQNYVFLVECGSILKKLKYKPGLTKRKPGKSKSVLVINFGDNKIKETIFKNIKIDGTNDLTYLCHKFVVYQIRNSYYIRYCTDVTRTMISFNDYQKYPPKKETIGISGNLIYGYTFHYSILPTTSMYKLKDIKLICYEYQKRK